MSEKRLHKGIMEDKDRTKNADASKDDFRR